MQYWQLIAIGVALVLVIAAAAGFIFQKSRAQRLRERLLPLSASDRLRFSSEWMKCQIAFVEDPAVAVDTADHLISEVLRARGCPVAIVLPRHRRQASTEDLRKAFIHYRALFEEILGVRHEELKRAA